MAQRVPVARPLSGADIDRQTTEIVQAFQPDAILTPQAFRIDEFFECKLEESFGVSYDYRELTPGIHGLTDIEKRECVVSLDLLNSTSHGQRRYYRSTTAHETGHGVLHVEQFRRHKRLLRFIHDDDHMNLRLHRQEHIRVFENPEWQAWRFAKGLLMPKSAVITGIEAGLSVRDLAETFDVNPKFVESRLRELKLESRIPS